MSSKKPRRKWTPAQKLRIVLETLQSEGKVAQICRREGISPHQVYHWRTQLMGAAETIFARPSNGRADPKIEKLEGENRRMKNVIAEITAENLDLKKTLSD